MNNGGSNGTGCFEINIWADAAKLRNIWVAAFRKSRHLVKKVRCSSKMKPRLRAECTVSSEQELLLASCCLSPMRSTVSPYESVQFGFLIKK